MIDVQFAAIENVDPAARGSIRNRGDGLKGRTGHLPHGVASSLLIGKSGARPAIRRHERSNVPEYTAILV
ncbi:hypothetical protein LTR46_007674 [Exophiala xenobiotica]|nr:hypothetical protein LTR46_007674 [Exophiala xenobiotica]